MAIISLSSLSIAAAHSPPIVRVDAHGGARRACGVHGQALEVGGLGTLSILDGDDEKEYWDKIGTTRDGRGRGAGRGRGRGGRRGGFGKGKGGGLCP